MLGILGTSLYAVVLAIVLAIILHLYRTCESLKYTFIAIQLLLLFCFHNAMIMYVNMYQFINKSESCVFCMMSALLLLWIFTIISIVLLVLALLHRIPWKYYVYFAYVVILAILVAMGITFIRQDQIKTIEFVPKDFDVQKNTVFPRAWMYYSKALPYMIQDMFVKDAFYNWDYKLGLKFVGPRQRKWMKEAKRQKKQSKNKCQICSFL